MLKFWLTVMLDFFKCCFNDVWILQTWMLKHRWLMVVQGWFYFLSIFKVEKKTPIFDCRESSCISTFRGWIDLPFMLWSISLHWLQVSEVFSWKFTNDLTQNQNKCKNEYKNVLAKNTTVIGKRMYQFNHYNHCWCSIIVLRIQGQKVIVLII